MSVGGTSIAYYSNSKGVKKFLMNRFLKELEMTKISQPGGPDKNARDRIKTNKKNARIGFLESMGGSGYDNRTDPNYCFDVLQNFMKGNEPEEEALG